MTESEKEAAAMVARQRAAIKAAEQVRRKPRCRLGCVHLLNKLPPAPPQRHSGSPYPTESHVRTECHGSGGDGGGGGGGVSMMSSGSWSGVEEGVSCPLRAASSLLRAA